MRGGEGGGEEERGGEGVGREREGETEERQRSESLTPLRTHHQVQSGRQGGGCWLRRCLC